MHRLLIKSATVSFIVLLLYHWSGISAFLYTSLYTFRKLFSLPSMEKIRTCILLFLLLGCIPHMAVARTFKMGLLAPFSLDYDFSGSTSGAAVDIAIEKVHSDPFLNADGKIQLSYIWRDTGCNSKQSIGAAVDVWYNESVDAFLGPPCSISCRSASEIASFYRIPLISWVATDPDLNDKALYSTLIRTLGPFSKMGSFILEIMAQYGWRRVVIAASNYLLYYDAAKAIRRVFMENNITIAYDVSYDRFPTDAFIDNFLTKTKMEGRIVFLVSPKEDRRRMMLKAYDFGMTDGDYVFYTIDMLPDEDVLDPDSVWRGNDGRDFVARKAFECVFHVSLAALSGADVRAFRVEVAERMREYPWNKTLAGVTMADRDRFDQGDKYAPFLHDAVILYAIALNETYRKNQDLRDGQAIAKNMQGKSFKGISGNLVLDAQGDREPDYVILDMNPFTGSFVKIAEVLNTENYGRNEGEDEYVREFRKNVRPTYWPGGKVGKQHAPPDVPVCGFMGEFCKEVKVDTWVWVLTVVAACVLISAVIFIAVFFYRRNKFETDLLIQSWRIMKPDVEMVNSKGTVMKSTTTISSSNSGGSGSNADIADLAASTSKASSQLKSLSSMGNTQQQIFADIAYYKGILIALKYIKKDHIQLSRSVLLEFNEVKALVHENLNVFVGCCLDPPIFLAWQYCTKGSLSDLIMNDDVKLDTNFKLSFMTDISKGMDYIHKSHMHSHGNLKSSNILVDARWTAKIADFGLASILQNQNSETDDFANFRVKLWTAPEILRENFPNPRGTQKGDVYSFAIICFEIMTRTEPFSFDTMTPRDVVNRIRNGESIPFRPSLPDTTEMGKVVIDLIRNSWHENLDMRPTFAQIRSIIKKRTGGEINIMDNILAMMEKYAYNLEEIVEERTEQLIEEKQKTDKLLYRMLPSTVAEALKAGKFVQPQNYDTSTIYFSDIVGFTQIAAESNPMQIVDFLNDLYSCFDEVIDSHDVYKVETIGDAYMVVSGVPILNGDRHVAEIANCALDLLSAVTHFRIRHRPKEQLQLRIGLHTGPVVAGVVGLMMPRYCLFGDTVNMAARMESSGKPLRIHISKQCYIALSEISGYDLTLRGEMNVKGKGYQTTYWLHGKKGYNKPLPSFNKADVAQEDMPKKDHQETTPHD